MSKLISIIVLIISFQMISLAQSGYGTELTGNFVLPIGKNAEYYNVGFGGLVGFYYDITDNLRMALVLGYLRSGINESKVNKYYANDGQDADIKGGVGAIPVLLSLRLISPGPGMRFYGMLEGGIYTYRTNFSGIYGSGAPLDESEFRSEPGFVFGGGLLFPFNKEISLDVNIRYHWIQDSEYINYTGSSIANSRLLSLGVGVNWFFSLKKP